MFIHYVCLVNKSCVVYLITVLNAWSIFDQSVLIFTGDFCPDNFTRHSRWIILKCELHAPVRKSSRSFNGGSSWCSPGPLPRTTPESHVLPACCREEHLCLLSVRPTFRLAYSLGVRPAFRQTMISSSRTVYVSLCFGEIHFSTDFRLPLWAISHNDPVHAVGWGFSTELLRELTVHKLIIVHESTRFSLCSTKEF